MALEASFCKPGNVCPTRALSFNYFRIVDDAFNIALACSKTKKLGMRYHQSFKAQRGSTLTGFIILVMPLTLEDPWSVRDLLEESDREDVSHFINGLRELGLSHFKRVEARDYPDFDRAKEYDNLYELFLALSKYSSLFREIVEGYPNAVSTASFLMECGINEQCLLEAQRVLLLNTIDDLIVRRYGFEVMARLKEMASARVHHIFIEEKGLNPGTTADLIATAIYLILTGLHEA